MSRLQAEIEKRWYGRPGILRVLWPLEGLFRLIAALRARRMPQSRLPVPVIVVGNITVGGTGKSPLVAALVRHFHSRGVRAGVISRGYGGRGPFPADASLQDARICGDEPIMLARMTGVPVFVSPDRHAAAMALCAQHGVDVLISDDGLQHYALARDLEIVVIDAMRGLGNGHCLPVGPLRESPERLSQVDFVVWNGGRADRKWPMQLQPVAWVHVKSGRRYPLDHLNAQRIHALAGIGHPERFFQTVADVLPKTEIVRHPFPDHYAFKASDLPQSDEPVVMTAKDAVKCEGFAKENMWMLAVEAYLPDTFWQAFDARFDRITEKRGMHG